MLTQENSEERGRTPAQSLAIISGCPDEVVGVGATNALCGPIGSTQLTKSPDKSKSPSPNSGTLLVGRLDAVHLLGTSSRTWDRLVSSGRTPKPIRLGGRPMWRVDELREWVAAGCPDRKTWEVISKS